jgi:hypothetical protein
MTRTPAQQLALDYHCRLALETLHPRFRQVDGLYNVILTVNSGYE